MKSWALFIVFILSFNTYAQGKIDKAEKSLKTTNKTEGSYSKSTYKDLVDKDENTFLTDIVEGLFVKLFAYTIYAVAFESPFEMEHKGHYAFLTKHPYQDTYKGHYSYEWNNTSEIFTTTLINRFIFESNRVYGNHVNIDLKFLKRWSLKMDYLQLWEDHPNFENNALAIYTVMIKYHRIRTERFTGWWGLGAAYIDGEVNTLGFTYGLGAELFLVKPISLESNFIKTAINSNSVSEFNVLLNYHIKQYKISLGYEHLKIGSVRFSNISIGTAVSF